MLVGSKSTIQAEADKVRTDLDAVSSSAKTLYRPQIDAVKSAVSDLETALSHLGNGNAKKNLQDVGSAINETGSYSALLITTLESECPSG
jgi:hypothetical protein